MYQAPFGPGYGQQQQSHGPGQSPHMQPGMSPPPTQQQQSQQQQGTDGQQAGFQQMGMQGGPVGSHNATMAQGGPYGHMAFQNGFAGMPQGAGVPTTAGGHPQMAQNYVMGGQQMTPQQMQQMQILQQQRMAQMQQMQAGTHQRQPSSSASGMSNGMVSSAGPQSSTPVTTSSQNTPQRPTAQTQSLGNQTAAASLSTPQTPSFPQNTAAGATDSAPLSPGTQSLEQERFSLLLEINSELLYESVQLKNTRDELKKAVEQASADGNSNTQTQEMSAKEDKELQEDWAQVFRRLQANLTYLVSLADRKTHPQQHPCPAYLSPPKLNLNLKLRPAAPIVPEGGTPSVSESAEDLLLDRKGRGAALKEMYTRLQGLFPGIDPTKEPAFDPTKLAPTAQRGAAPQGTAPPASSVQPAQSGLPAAATPV